MEQKLLRIPEGAAALGISRSTAYLLVNSGELRTVKIGKSRRIPATAIDEFVRRKEQEGSDAA